MISEAQSHSMNVRKKVDVSGSASRDFNQMSLKEFKSVVDKATSLPKTRKHKTIPEVRSEQAFIEMLEVRNDEMLESKRRPLAGPTTEEVNCAFYRGMFDNVFNHPEVRKPISQTIDMSPAGSSLSNKVGGCTENERSSHSNRRPLP